MSNILLDVSARSCLQPALPYGRHSMNDGNGRTEHVPRGDSETLVEDCMEIRATQGTEMGVVDQLLLVSEEMRDCIPTEFGPSHMRPFKLGWFQEDCPTLF